MPNMQFYKIQDLTTHQALLYPIATKIQDLRTHISLHCNQHCKYQIYYKYQLILQKQNGKTLSQIIKEKNTSQVIKPEQEVFQIIQTEVSAKQNQNYLQLSARVSQGIQKQQQQIQSHSTGSNGTIIYQGRERAVLASSIKHAVNLKQYEQFSKIQCQKELQNSLKKISQSKIQNAPPLSTFQKILQKIGLVKGKPQKQKLTNSIMMLQQSANQQQLNQSKIDKKFSDFDPKFVAYLEQIYLKFMINNLGKLHYINYNSMNDFIIEKTIPKNSKVGIIGDFGTGLKDSIQLLRNMIINHQVNVILHLGDVYYAGTPQEYEVSITKPLTQIRLQLKRQILFYSIPGNHDYYSWGLPYLCFIKEINKNQFQRQKASYFCLRDEMDNWQFLGIDTAYHDSNPTNQISPFSLGPHIRHKQLQWHKDKIQNFSGSTILLSHHQLFSIHDRLSGTFTKYKTFSCVNPMLSAQLFEYLPYISCWFWGHQHSFMLFKQKILALSKGRLLGNSSFHVFYQKEHPYKRKEGFPMIPLIQQDEAYLKKYLPINPHTQSLVQQYFNLCYAVIDMQKMDKNLSLPIKYYCSPCYSDEEQASFQTLPKKQLDKIYFKQYQIHNEIIQSALALTQKMKNITSKDKVYILSQLGLMVSYNQGLQLSLNIQGKAFTYYNMSQIQNQFKICLNLENYLKQLCLACASNGKLYFSNEINEESIWLVQKIKIMKRLNNQSNHQLRYMESFNLKNYKYNKYLGWSFNKDAIGIIQIMDAQKMKQEEEHLKNNSSIAKFMFTDQNVLEVEA